MGRIISKLPIRFDPPSNDVLFKLPPAERLVIESNRKLRPALDLPDMYSKLSNVYRKISKKAS